MKKDTMIVPLSISRVPMHHAFTWFKNALLLIQAQPLIMFLTSAWIVFAELFLSGVIPVIGTVIFFIISPAIAFGMADICQRIRLQETTTPLNLFSPLIHSVRSRLLSLGLIFATLLFALFIISQTFIDQTAMSEIINKMMHLQDLDNLDEIRTQSKQVFTQILQHKSLVAAFGLILAGSTLAQILLMYSPMYAVWQNAQAPQAVLLSIRTIFKNILPIALAIAITIATLIALSFTSTVLSMAIPSIAMLFMMAAWIVFNTLVNALTYTSYYDIIRSSLTDSVKDSINKIIDIDPKP